MEKGLVEKEKKQACGIVFSDLECTLIGGGIIETWELYEKACCDVSKLIDLILSFNNYFVIVSSSHHDTKERVARKYNIINNYLSEGNRDKILFFISQVSADDGKDTIQKFDDVRVRLIGEKVECIDYVLKELLSKGIEIGPIIGLGDDEKDVDMLLKIQELGGQAATVAEKDMSFSNLFNYPEINESNYKEIIGQIAEKEYHIDKTILISHFTKQKLGKNFLGRICSDPRFQEINRKQQLRQEELINLYEIGEVDDKYLQKSLYIAQLAYRYFDRYYNAVLDNEVGFGEEILKKVSGISEYHSTQTLSRSASLLESPKIKSLLMRTNN